MDRGGERGGVPFGGMAIALLRASDWFNDALLETLASRGWPRLNRSQSLTFASLEPEGRRPVDLARDVGISRQSMQSLLEELMADGLITLVDDPTDGRAKLVQVTERGHRLAADAIEVLQELEEELGERIGADAVAFLREVLVREWGPPPTPPG